MQPAVENGEKYIIKTVEDLSTINSDAATDEHSSIKNPGSGHRVSAENYGSSYGSIEDLGSAGNGSTEDRSLRERSIKNHDSATGQEPTDHHSFVVRDSAGGRGRGFTTTGCLEGLVRTDGHGRQLVLLDGNTVYRRGHRSMSSGSGRVKVMAGHRGGHYPAFARYVGAGMLDAAVAGPDQGRHPTATQVLTAIRELDDRCGVLVLVANEMAAILNYGIAAQKARAQGIVVKLLAIGDDVIRSQSTTDGRRRGAAGIVLMCKIAGALAAGGHSLTKIFAVCQRLSMDRMATVNAVIGLRKRMYNENSSSESEEDMLLLGTDANGRNEIRTVRTTDLTAMVSVTLNLLTNDNQHIIRRWRDADIVAMVNNMGGMSDARFMAIVAELTDRLGAATGARGVHRWYTGRMLPSSGDTDHGFSVTIMDVGTAARGSAPADERVYGGLCYSLMTCLDFPVSASGWTFTGLDGRLDLAQHPPPEYVRRQIHCPCDLLMGGNDRGGDIYEHDEDDDDNDFPPSPIVPEDQVPFVTEVLIHVCDRIVETESQMNAMDEADDGDCGSNWRRGAEAIREAITAGKVDVTNPASTLRSIGRLLETRMAGTLGTLLSILFRSFSLSFSKHSCRVSLRPSMWVDGLRHGIAAVEAYGMRQPGNRTILDALVPAVLSMEDVLRKSKNPIRLLNRAVREADAGCKLTEHMIRGGEQTSNYGADAGAYGVKTVLEAILEKYTERSAAAMATATAKNCICSTPT
ncbi:triokinase/FMN cyclase-like [Melanaphis sacchari]|uniref:triokinase/FMN cyclase-like n=1 Tax=Melanaphis sacchari TaxID=742174 RepID=UPI000DC1562B|nr:triokinase/FMN cyclase-like [Melanaphis sacchari]